MPQTPRFVPLAAAWVMFALAGRAAEVDQADAGAPAAQTDEELRRELEKALQQDAAAPRPTGSSQAATSPGRQAPPEATGASGAPPPLFSTGRGSQSLNPDISAIIDGDFGYERRTPAFRSGDDPALRSTPRTAAAGFALQEVEAAFSAIVDPYFKGEVFLTIPNLGGLEVEEAFATTTSLPYSLQLKAGSFRSAFGRQNGQHLHVQDFTRRPLVNSAFLGADGLRGPGAQLSWLTPLPVYLAIFGEAFSLAPSDPGAPVASFGGGKGTDLAYAAEAKAFFPLTEDVSVYAGLNGATGISPNSAIPDPGNPGPSVPANRRSLLVGGDLYVKWKPPNVASGYQSLAWQTEAIFRHLGGADCALAACAAVAGEWDGGLYSQVVYQFARRWFLGVRGDLLGLPSSSAVPPIQRGALSLTFQPSEFARVRAYAEVEHVGNAVFLSPGSSAFTLTPDGIASAAPGTSAAAYLQLEISIGAHGAHPF